MCVTVVSQISTAWNATRNLMAMKMFNMFVNCVVKFKCETCRKQFKRESNLRRHKGVHEPDTREVLFKGIKNDAGDARHVCEKCKTHFCTSKLLRSHVCDQ